MLTIRKLQMTVNFCVACIWLRTPRRDASTHRLCASCVQSLPAVDSSNVWTGAKQNRSMSHVVRVHIAAGVCCCLTLRIGLQRKVRPIQQLAHVRQTLKLEHQVRIPAHAALA